MKMEKHFFPYNDQVNEEIKQISLDWPFKEESTLLELIEIERPIADLSLHFKLAGITEQFQIATEKTVPVEFIANQIDSMFDLDLEKPDDECVCNLCNFDGPVVDYVLDPCYLEDVPAIKVYTRQKVKQDEAPSPPTPPAVTAIKANTATDSPRESEDEDVPLKPAKPGRKSKVLTPVTKAETPKRGTRAGASKDASHASTKKGDDDKKERQSQGGRSLRPRGEDETSSPAPTPPPAKRARRI